MLSQFLLGLVAFFFFFAAMFNGLDLLMAIAAIGGLALNFLVSLLLARKHVRNGKAAALAFAAPALLFSLFALGDAFAYGKLAPFLFWFSGGLVALASGLLGVAVAAHRT